MEKRISIIKRKEIKKEFKHPDGQQFTFHLKVPFAQNWNDATEAALASAIMHLDQCIEYVTELRDILRKKIPVVDTKDFRV